VEIKFISLTLQNYKAHRDLEVKFGDVTKITGGNEKGKSTIPESLCWLLYGVNMYGGKIDSKSSENPTPITYEADETLVQLLFTFDGKNKLIGKAIENKKVVYYIDEVPKKAKEFDELVLQLFGERDLFMSLYIPTYFSGLHPDRQREMFLKYVPNPARKDVLKCLSKPQADVLELNLKKYSKIEDLMKFHKDNKNKKDTAHKKAQGNTETYQKLLDELPVVNVPIESLKVELAQIDKKVKELEIELDTASEKNYGYNKIQSQISATQDQIDMSKERWPSLKNEVIVDTCRTCKRPLDDGSVAAVQSDKERRIVEYKENHTNLLTQRELLKEQLAKLEFIDVKELREQIKEIDEKGQPLRMALQSYSQFERLQEQVAAANVNESEILKSLNDSIFVLDSIKAFNAKSAELQAEKVQALFTTISVRLYKQNIGDGELTPHFEIERDRIPYRTLSHSGKIKAGLELRDVLSQQSELVVPCLVDDAESITSFKQPNGQLITSSVVAGQELKIEAVSE
jgi:predicted ATPase